MIATTYRVVAKLSALGVLGLPWEGSWISRTHPSVYNNRHNNLALRVAVTSNVPREGIHISHQLRLASQGRRTADSATECYDLASDFALERP